VDQPSLREDLSHPRESATDVIGRNTRYVASAIVERGAYAALSFGSMWTPGSFAVNVVPDQYYLIRLDAIGNQLRAYLDNRLLFEATDSAHASGSPGLAAFKARAEYNYFLAYQP
jgi:hypothetical protein